MIGKRIQIAVLAAALVLVLCACGETKNTAMKENGMHIVCTIFPAYDWTRHVMGELATEDNLTLLMDAGVDMHSFQPSAADVIGISMSDLFVYVGGESDAWVDDALSEAVNKDMKTVNMIEVLGAEVREEEIVEGMQQEDEAETDEVEYDEHVWLSPAKAQTLTQAICDALCELDAANEETYRANTRAYLDELAALDEAYREAVDAAPKRTVLFADRFPFRYLADDYALTYYAAFPGCSAETEASFETVVYLAGKVDELKLPAVLVVENSDQAIARTVVENSASPELPVLVMDSMQSVSAKDAEAGVTYCAVMEKNLAVLKEALH